MQRFSGAFQEIRAFLEGQVLARRLHAFRLGIRCTSYVDYCVPRCFLIGTGHDLLIALHRKTRVIVTGGASANHSILKVRRRYPKPELAKIHATFLTHQVIASVFGCPVYVQDYQNSAGIDSASWPARVYVCVCVVVRAVVVWVMAP